MGNRRPVQKRAISKLVVEWGVSRWRGDVPMGLVKQLTGLDTIYVNAARRRPQAGHLITAEADEEQKCPRISKVWGTGNTRMFEI